MKKVIPLFLALLMCLSLCSCGKSEAVTNVEALIEAIGEVSAESEDAVVLAEDAYNALTDKEKEKVENFTVLTDARAALDVALEIARHEALEASFAGEWVSELKRDFSIQLNTDGTLTLDGFDGTWALNEEETALDLSFAGLSISVKIIEEDGFQKLDMSAINSWCLVKAENYQAAFDKKFIAVELSGENVKEYLGDPVHIGYGLDAWGEEDKQNPVYLLTSKVYEDGLVYIGCSDDFAVELIWESTYENRKEPIAGNPFSLIWGYDDNDGYYNRPVSIGERAAGTLYYVRSEYVVENSINSDGRRDVKLTNGSVYSPEYYESFSYRYEDYMR